MSERYKSRTTEKEGNEEEENKTEKLKSMIEILQVGWFKEQLIYKYSDNQKTLK